MIHLAGVGFPPNDKELCKILGLCNQGQIPATFGEKVDLDEYNTLLENSTLGLRLSYDHDLERVLVREGCTISHGTTRACL